jgi:hypothetical protein
MIVNLTGILKICRIKVLKNIKYKILKRNYRLIMVRYRLKKTLKEKNKDHSSFCHSNYMLIE